jgi:hypothetical protein
MPAEGNFGVNQPYIKALRFVIGVANTNTQLPQIPVPEGMQLLLRGWPTNGNIVYITGSSANQNQINDSYPMLANETLSLRVRNANTIYVAAVVAGESLAIIVEYASKY